MASVSEKREGISPDIPEPRGPEPRGPGGVGRGEDTIVLRHTDKNRGMYLCRRTSA